MQEKAAARVQEVDKGSVNIARTRAILGAKLVLGKRGTTALRERAAARVQEVDKGSVNIARTRAILGAKLALAKRGTTALRERAAARAQEVDKGSVNVAGTQAILGDKLKFKKTRPKPPEPEVKTTASKVVNILVKNPIIKALKVGINNFKKGLSDIRRTASQVSIKETRRKLSDTLKVSDIKRDKARSNIKNNTSYEKETEQKSSNNLESTRKRRKRRRRNNRLIF